MELPPSLVLTNSEPDIEGVFVFEHGELMSSTIDVSIDESPPSPERNIVAPNSASTLLDEHHA